MKKIILMALALSMTAVGAYANDQSDGCGLGWQVTKKNSFFATTTRGTTNFVVPPTFGMTSGTIGCTQHSFAQADMKAAEFVASNMEPLMQDMAMGRGEYLDSLAQTMGCSESRRAGFGKAVQANYKDIAGKNSVEVFERVKALSSGCRS